MPSFLIELDANLRWIVYRSTVCWIGIKYGEIGADGS